MITLDKNKTEKPVNREMPPTGRRQQMPFNRVNFLMMGGCILLIIVGFLLMSGGGSSEEVTFNPDIFSTRRIVVGPLLTFLGFLLMAFAIIWHPKKKEK